MTQRTPLRRGFSLIELCVVAALLSTLSFMLLLNVGRSSERIKSEGLARALVEELRAARALASQEQTPVVVAFPAAPGGGACRSFRVYRGEDQLQPTRTLNFDQEYQSYIFHGTWPAASAWETASTVPPAVQSLFSENHLLLFRPDGSVLTTLPRQNGTICLLVGNALEFSGGEGLSGSLSAVQNPNTVLVQPSGSVILAKGLFAASAPIKSTDRQPKLLTLNQDKVPDAAPPVLEEVSFFPQSASQKGVAGMGKTYIEIHPVSGEKQTKEYGLATITAEATDPNGGPLFMQVNVQASDGPTGTLAAEGPVRMEYLQGRWVGTLGWRPPADASPEVTYRFEVSVVDPTGLQANAGSDASVVPALRTLTDHRLAIEAVEGGIYLTNLEGGEVVRISPPGFQESKPVWSGDGTKLYALHTTGNGTSFIRYNADGTEREVVSEFPKDASGFTMDQSGMYLSYVHGATESVFETLKEGKPGQTSVTTYTLSVLHVSNGKNPAHVVSGLYGGFSFLPYERGLFQYSTLAVGEEDGPVFDQDLLPIEGETKKYATIGSNIGYAKATGLGPTISSVGVSNPANLLKAAFNTADPSYLARPAAAGDGKPKRLALFNLKDGKWQEVAMIAKDIDVHGIPAWSANGDWIAYLVRTGESSYSLRVQNVVLPPDPDDPVLISDPRSINFPGGEVAQPLPTPDGEAVLYIEGSLTSTQSKLMSLKTTGTEKPVQIGTSLEGVASFAITQ